MTYRAPGETADRLWPLSHLPLLIDEADWQQLTAGIVQRAAIAGTGAERPLWRGPAGRRGRDPGGGHCRQHRISARGLRHQAAGRPLSQSLCRRCRPRPRRALVGAGRPHPGAVGRGLRAGKPAGAVARLRLALQVDERRTGGAVLRGVPRCLARQRRPRRAAHRAADARPVQRNLFRARHAGALSRLPAGRGRRSRRQRRPHSYPHRRRPEAARRAAAPGRFQFSRSAGAGCLLAARRARPDRRAAQERRRRRQHAGLGRDGGEGAARLPAQPEPASSSAKI